MKKTLLAITAAALVTPALPVLSADSPLSANIGVFSDYRFRGVSQTDKKAAVQGGFDYSAPNGFYVGNWNSSISWIGQNSSGLESDFYIGYATEMGGIGIDVGNLYYAYPGASDTNTNEVYLGLSYGPITFKTSYSTSDYFGTANTDGTLYYNLSGSFELSDGVSLTAAAGYTKLKGSSEADGYDYSVGISYGLPEGFELGVSYISTSGDYKVANESLGSDAAFVVSISKSF
jgi:uncharacterized protein (TIGR02001 family)